MFAGEAYNVEMGITNQLFPQERDETPGCLFNATPEDALNFTTTPATTANSNTAVISDIEAFANFMRMLAPPTPAPATPYSENGRSTFAFSPARLGTYSDYELFPTELVVDGREN
jgi:hypothetical protein